MALCAQNPLFQIVGVGPAAEGLDVVVGLQHRQIHALQNVGSLVGDVAGIRQDTDGAAGGVQPETTGTGSVMGCGKCRHGKLSDRLGDAEVQRVQPCLCAGQPPGQLPGGPLGGKNRGGAALEQRLQAGDVVRVGVRDENGREASELQAQLPQSGSDAAAGNARIQQNIALPAGEQQRVPGGTACQRMYGGQKTYLFR